MTFYRTRRLIDQSAKPASPRSGAALPGGCHWSKQRPAWFRDYPSCQKRAYTLKKSRDGRAEPTLCSPGGAREVNSLNVLSATTRVRGAQLVVRHQSRPWPASIRAGCCRRGGRHPSERPSQVTASVGASDRYRQVAVGCRPGDPDLPAPQGGTGSEPGSLRHQVNGGDTI